MCTDRSIHLSIHVVGGATKEKSLSLTKYHRFVTQRFRADDQSRFGSQRFRADPDFESSRYTKDIRTDDLVLDGQADGKSDPSEQ